MRPPVRSVHVRLPKTLHEKLMARAVDEGVSLSLLVATLLAAAHPYDFRPDPDEPPSPAGGTDQEPEGTPGDDAVDSSAEPEEQPVEATEATP